MKRLLKILKALVITIASLVGIFIVFLIVNGLMHSNEGNPLHRAQEILLHTHVEWLCELKKDCGKFPAWDGQNLVACDKSKNVRGSIATLERLSRSFRSDIWNHPLVVKMNEQGGTLTSLGKDGKPGGTGQDADIVQEIRCDSP